MSKASTWHRSPQEKPAKPLTVFLHSRRGLGAEAVARRHAAGLAAGDGPYGFDALQEESLFILFSEDGKETRLSRLLFRLLGFDFLHGLNNLRRMRNAEVIWTVLEWEWLEVSLLQRLGLLPSKPVIANSVWICEEFTTRPIFQRWLWKSLMTPEMKLTLHSQRALTRSKLLFPGKRFQTLAFGISTEAFPITPPDAKLGSEGPLKIYSIGNDRTRDWRTLLEAFGNDERFLIRLMCSWLPDNLVEQYWNLEIPRDPSIGAQRMMYQWADLVIVPMKENCFSGITVACEAVAMGVPVIASRTGGVDTYFNESEVTLVEPERAEEMRDAVLRLSLEGRRRLARRAQQKFLDLDYSSAGMVRRYIALTREIIKKK